MTGLALAAGAAAAAHHDHLSHGTTHAPLVTAAAGVASGEICLDHWLAAIAGCDTTPARYGQSVNDEMLTVRSAPRGVAIQNVDSLPGVTRVAHDVCRRCEWEYRRHAHTQCRNCAEACSARARECEASKS